MSLDREHEKVLENLNRVDPVYFVGETGFEFEPGLFDQARPHILTIDGF